MSQEGVKTENNEHINLKVAGQDGSVVQFKIKRHTPLIKLMKAYCERQVGMAQYHNTQSIMDGCGQVKMFLGNYYPNLCGIFSIGFNGQRKDIVDTQSSVCL